MYDGFFEIDGSGNMVPKASVAGELDMYWDLDVDGNMVPRATALTPTFPAEGSVLPRAGAFGWTGEYAGDFEYPPPAVVENDYWYGSMGAEFRGIFSPSGSIYHGGTIRQRIRDAGARSAFKIGQRLGFALSYKAHETATQIDGLIGIDISSDEAKSIFGGDVDGISRTIEIPRQVNWPPSGGIKVGARVLITEDSVTKAYALERVHYATARITDAATINLLLRRWDDFTVELDG